MILRAVVLCVCYGSRSVCHETGDTRDAYGETVQFTASFYVPYVPFSDRDSFELLYNIMEPQTYIYTVRHSPNGRSTTHASI